MLRSPFFISMTASLVGTAIIITFFGIVSAQAQMAGHWANVDMKTSRGFPYPGVTAVRLKADIHKEMHGSYGQLPIRYKTKRTGVTTLSKFISAASDYRMPFNTMRAMPVMGSLTRQHQTAKEPTFDKENSLSSMTSWRDEKQFTLDRTEFILRFWRAPTRGERLIFLGISNSVLSIAWNLGGKRFLSGDFHRSMRLWDRGQPTAKLAPNGYRESVVLRAFSTEEKGLITASEDRSPAVSFPTLLTTRHPMSGFRHPAPVLEHREPKYEEGALALFSGTFSILYGIISFLEGKWLKGFVYTSLGVISVWYGRHLITK